MTRIAVLQMTSDIDPAINARTLVDAAESAAAGGAAMLFTPEMSGLLDRNRARAARNIVAEAHDPCLAAVREAARRLGIWISLGSLAIEREDGRWANRAFVIDAQGAIVARYDKIHMFDVELATGETWRESSAYAAGSDVITAETPVGQLGLTVCYDIRFPALFEELSKHRCDVIAIPAAFTQPTGKAHWHLLQRARAVEASAYVVAAAQVGTHADVGGEAPGLGFATIDPTRIADVRKQLPSLANRRPIPKSEVR
jgi:predicted amidohydrolase